MHNIGKKNKEDMQLPENWNKNCILKNTTETSASLLKRYHFYWKNCETQEKLNYNELKTKCEKKESFIDLRFEKLYKKLITNGIYIKKPSIRDIIILLISFIYKLL
ncbi:uncharacterized protein T551_02052 [Pneumocystis jirovecii RU7]|uniref:Uncharacterized protein n=1 Tax=Pneumocystis jirovecii (strain RU7) TaxID=1408657 RepID=A0A0W4ZHF6_PNEJ7|nr:uncharacterized protein T551_02776 [Pneumocystis jirovecii RU7]XP_018229669.1 uncharacterized protein T551_02052 [Pneumocystis jirovecii RU7]KTW27809.1 hypothetical protein T551_02776 [Pneumocystis jirovecii RU7]KTW30108.1 hypothetical protein T551_02052 [Pneumocystis jirovecii RU7]